MADEVTFEQFRKEWMSDIQAGDPSTTRLGNRFSHKILTQWLDVDDDTEDPVYCDGAGDGGIDIAYLHRKEAADGGGDGDTLAMGDTWYLVQSKYGSAFKGITTLIEESQKVIDSLDGKRAKLSSLAAALLERLTTFRQQASERDKIVLVFATEDPLNEDQKRALEDVKSMGRGRFGPLFDVESVSLDVIYKRTLEEAAGADDGKVKVSLAADLVESGPNLLVGSTSLVDLYEFLKRYKKATLDLDQLYEKNVRRFLGGRGKVNKAMQQTLREQPEQFGLFNNGITLTVANFTMGPGGYELVEPYVVNGCQTTRTIWEVCQQKLEAGGTGKSDPIEEWKTKLKQGVVVTKIVKVGATGEALLQDITRYTNSQNAVKEKDFLTLTSDFRTWAKQMEAKHNVFLEVQRGGWESRRALQKQRPDVKQFTDAANAFDLLKVYGSGWLGEAGTAYGRNAAFLPNGSIFKRIMNGDGEQPFGVEDLYAAYRLQQATESFKFGRTAEKNSRRQTKFLFPMVVTELLKDVISKLGQVATPTAITKALSKLFEPSNEETLNVLLDTAIQALDDYMNPGEEDSIYNEPAFKNDFNNDLNGMLKWDGLGKGDDTTPRFRALISKFRTVMGMGVAGKKPRDLITAAIK